MEKKRMFRVLSKADAAVVQGFAEEIKAQHETVIIKKPEKSLAMIKMREPVKESLFYLGEVMITEAIVEVNAQKGIAVTMGDQFDKTLNMALIDAAVNAGVFTHMDVLEKLEQEQKLVEEKENAMFMNTMVNFHSMDSEGNE